jgi:Asp-tRNA(Asn)/Glu-tRNA(Gln) amidotransferase A subunit family amidase
MAAMNKAFHRRAIFALGAALVATGLLANCSTPPARAASASADRAFIEYWPPSPDSQMPRLAVKDLIDMKGVVTTGGSKYLTRMAKPASRDAACLSRARERGVQFVGKTNLGELGLGVSGANDFYGTPVNPVKPRLRFVPGGSSSGSAVAVGNGKADIALGTDTAGSIRIPAACCGVAGLKTTFGLVPLAGVLPLAPRHLDTVGPLAKDIPHLVQGMDLLQAGFLEDYRRTAARSPAARDITIGRLYVRGTDPAIDAAVDAALRAAGFRVVRLSDDFAAKWAQAQDDGKRVAAAESWITDHDYANKPGVNDLTKAALRLGRLEYQTNYASAIARRPAWQRALRKEFRKVDFIATPTLLKLPPRISHFGRSAMLELRVFEIQNTVAVNLAGNPALAMPIPLKDRLSPVASLQLVGPPRSEAGLLHAGRFVEKALGRVRSATTASR